MLIVKSLHIIFMVTWMAGLFYLPRLFVYHSLSEDAVSIARFKVMERKLYWGIMTPGAVLTLVFGAWTASYGFTGLWLHLKLGIVALLVLYHLWCGKLLGDFRRDDNRHGHLYYRILNELPVVALVAIVFLVVMKPL